MAEPLGCGACNMCCELLQVPDISKPARMRCWHTTMHGGCARHHEKATAPELQACYQFKCVWLASQEQEEKDRLPRNLRPDQCGVVLGPQDPSDDKLLYVQVDSRRPRAWKEGVIAQYLEEVLSRGAKLEIIVDEMRVRLPDNGGPQGVEPMGAS